MLTPEKIADYVKNRSGNCPYCGGTNFDGDSFDMSGTTVAQRICCLDCGKAWNDIYTLSGIEEIAEEEPYVGYYLNDNEVYHTMYPNDPLGEFTDGRFVPSKFLLELPPDCHRLVDAWASKCRCIQVEYDLEFFGGDYDDCGNFAYLPLTLVDECGSVEKAFKKQTGYDPVHIIHYTPDELYTPDGELIED